MKPSAAPAPATTRPDSPSRCREVSSRCVLRVRLRVEAQSQGTVLTAILDPPPCTATGRVRPWQARSALGSAQRSTHLVTITTAMAAALAILTEALDEPGTDIAHSLHRLTLDAAAAIPSYLGLSVLVPKAVDHHHARRGAITGDIHLAAHAGSRHRSRPRPGVASPHPLRPGAGRIRRPRSRSGLAHQAATD